MSAPIIVPVVPCVSCMSVHSTSTSGGSTSLPSLLWFVLGCLVVAAGIITAVLALMAISDRLTARRQR